MKPKRKLSDWLYIAAYCVLGVCAGLTMLYVIDHGGGGFTESSVADMENEPVEVCGSDSIQIPPATGAEVDLCLSPRQQAYLLRYHRENPPNLKPNAARQEAARYELELSAWRSRQF